MIDRFSTLFKEIERDIGTNDLSLLVLSSMKDALERYDGKDVESLFAQMREILHIVTSTEPKFAIVIDNLFRVFEEIQACVIEAQKCGQHRYQDYKKCILGTVETAFRNAKNDWKGILKVVEKLNVEGKTILIHDQSRTVRTALLHLKKKKQNFKVIVAEQDIDKTLDNIDFLSDAQIPFQTVPDYMLSNITGDIDMCFFGALTLKSTFDFVASNGANAVVSQFHLHKIPTYIFLTTSKFALWNAQKKDKIKTHSHMRKHPLKDLTYERFKFSHDRIPLQNVTFTVTEEGILNGEEVKKVYRRKFEEHKAMTEKMDKL